MRIGVVTAGGDAPGLNAAIRAVARQAMADGHQVLGVRNGWAGLLERDYLELTRARIAGIGPVGGTLLGSSRCNLDDPPGGRALVHEHLTADLDALVAIGGDGTLSVANWLAERGAPVVGVPKTVDNDITGTEFCIGFSTAVATATEALDRLHTTAASHHRIMVVEVMGRSTGWVAASAGLAGGADLVVVPERPTSFDAIVEHLGRRKAQGSGFSIVVVAEGVDPAVLGLEVPTSTEVDPLGRPRLAARSIGAHLATVIEDATGFDARATVLGHLLRGGVANAHDRIWASTLGSSAARLACERRFGLAAVVRSGAAAVVPLGALCGPPRPVPDELLDLCEVFY